ncbi:MAG: YncE family protein [Nitrospiraceae bacterium]
MASLSTMPRSVSIYVRLALLVALLAGIGVAGPFAAPAGAYEVWLTDQSDTAKESGGFLYIYDGAQLAADPKGAKPAATIDLGGEIGKFCEEATKKPVRRPHMLFFTQDQSHAILSFLSGQVLFMDAATRKPEACLSVGKNVHAAWPTSDQKMAIAANMADKTLVRIWTDYGTHKFAFDAEKDVLGLGAMESPERPDNAPVCPVTDAAAKYAFVTLRGGGLLVADVTETPMKIVAGLDKGQVHAGGCGGIQVGDTLYVNSGGGWPADKFPNSASLAYDVYALDRSNLPKSISAKLLSTRDGKFADSHGMAAVGHYLWSADRAGNNIEILDAATNTSVGEINLAGPASDDPAPDLLDVSPDGQFVFVGTRGPNPLTGNDKAVNNAKGSTPGVGVIKVTGGGKGGEFVGVARISNMKDEKETADTHGIAVRK